MIKAKYKTKSGIIVERYEKLSRGNIRAGIAWVLLTIVGMILVTLV